MFCNDSVIKTKLAAISELLQCKTETHLTRKYYYYLIWFLLNIEPSCTNIVLVILIFTNLIRGIETQNWWE